MKYFEKACSPKCRSMKHAGDLISLITKTNDTHILLSSFMQCWNCTRIHDELGRCLIYMTASCGRTEAVDWLIKFKKADLQVRNWENGWTPAHASAFYGHIDTLILLIKSGANLNKLDHDTLNVLEHLSLDKYLSTPYKPDIHDDFDIYSWGSNTNYNLGGGHDMKKSNAEIIEFFKKLDTSVIQIVMSKFHTVFLTRNGLVYSCGFGVDGRLGHNDEEILMTPKLIDCLKPFKCIQIAASRNNSYFLTSEGLVYSCGTNEFKQLGHLGSGIGTKALVPKLVHLGKRLKGKQIKQIECSRFHVVLLTNTNEVFTFGLNAGQLGHPNERVENATNYNNQICFILEPRLITQLNEPELKIDLIACSEGVTVALQKSKNILYIFNDYKCKRLFYIKELNSQLTKIRVLGGKLDNQNQPELKWIEDLGDPLIIVGLTESNLIFIWRENDPTWKKVTWSPNKKILIADFDLNIQGLIVCTLQGQCYKANFQKSKLTNSPTSSSNDSSKTEILDLVPVPFVHRCFHVVNDRKARNYFCLQYHPNTAMRYYPIKQASTFSQDMNIYLDESLQQQKSTYFHVEPEFHDCELKYRNQVFYSNKYVLLFRASKFFLKMDLFKSRCKSSFDLDSSLANGKFSLQCFELLMKYMYTGMFCSDFIRISLKTAKIHSEATFQKLLTDLKELSQIFGLTELKPVFDSNGYTKSLKELNINQKSNEDRITIMTDFMFKLTSINNKKLIKFNRLSYAELYDCSIECNQNQSIKCHKCILISRSEYFKNMMMGYWMESKKDTIQLPFDVDLMQIIIDYFYTDEIQMDFIHNNQYSTSIKSKTEREIEILFNLYVLSDQLLIERLKNLCEFKITNLVNLKNIVEIFDFSNQYEAKQLRDFCMEFIASNLVTIIEAKQLELLNLDLLKEFSEFYRNYFPLIGSRRITPYPADLGLDPKMIDLIPIELLYDSKFVESCLEDELNNKKKLATQAASNRNEIEESEKLPLKEISINNNEQQTEIVNKQPEKEAESIGKWEKVKKKNRKTSETSTKLAIVKNNEEFLPKPEPVSLTPPPKVQFSQTTSPILEKKNEFDSLWPSLNENTQITKPKLGKFKKSTSKEIQIKKENSPVPAVAAASSLPAWSKKSNEITSQQHSLIDLMNEEMKKLKINSPPSIESKIKVISTNSTNSPKGWNMSMQPNTSSQTTTTTTYSIAQIIEMEKRSKDQYVKLKNRPLNLIQLEEAAIEDLKKFYNIDNITNMNIRIELVDMEEVNFPPVWKK